MTNKNNLQNLALRLGYTEERLLEVIRHAPKYYAPFHITSIRKDGSRKTRHIDNPHKRYPLRALQKSINRELLIPEISQLDKSLIGGIKGRGDILKHIAPHINKRTIVCMDLSNCFSNISYDRIVGVWLRLGYVTSIARLLASATTFRGYLPQGAPTSSLLCNFAMSPMASVLRLEMEARSISYTQYIDDLCFSGNDDVVRKMIDRVYKIVPCFDQRINKSKTRIMDAKHRQSLMGITVNKQTRMSASIVRRLEKHIELIESRAGVIDSFTSLSIAGQIEHIKRYDRRAGDHLERLFSACVKKIYEGGSKSTNDALEPCGDYRKDRNYRAKCRYLVE